jgi:uncharacterized protein (DUF697 family)/predicted GTPase
MLERLTSFVKLFSAEGREQEVRKRLAEARRHVAAPLFWLFGKTQSGKTTIIKYLTGATDAEVGAGFRPCTRFSRIYEFPTADAPLLRFLDTRGLGEAGYDPAEDLEQFNEQAQVMVVTVKVMDHAQEAVLEHLARIRSARPSRPVILALTCLHEAYPQQQHPLPYPFVNTLYPPKAPPALVRSIEEQQRRFKDFVDDILPIDLTPPQEGYNDPNYGGEELKQSLLRHLPEAYRQTFLTLDRATHEFRDIYLKEALPLILGYSTLASAAGAVPIPFVDLFLLPGIQTKMVMELAQHYGQPAEGKHFAELASSLGLGLMARQATRELTKLIPWVGMLASAALAGATTYALGRMFCYYYQEVREGHIPTAVEMKHFFNEQLAQAKDLWARKGSS